MNIALSYICMYDKMKEDNMNYKTTGICAREIEFEVDGNRVRNISFLGGCDGNLKGISSLVEGMEIEEAISRLKGITCKTKPTSCPDQLASALELYIKNNIDNKDMAV